MNGLIFRAIRKQFKISLKVMANKIGCRSEKTVREIERKYPYILPAQYVDALIELTKIDWYDKNNIKKIMQIVPNEYKTLSYQEREYPYPLVTQRYNPEVLDIFEYVKK